MKDTRPEKKKEQSGERAARKPSNCGKGFLKNRGRTKIRVCRTKAEEASTHHTARLNTGQKIQGSHDQWLNTKQCRLTLVCRKQGRRHVQLGTLCVRII